MRGAGAAVVAALAVAAACTPIEPVPLSNAPLNRCGCEDYGPEAQCQANTGRCQRPGRPPFPFFLVVDVPSSSFYAPATRFVLYSDETGRPAFARTSTGTAGVQTRCIGPGCVKLGGMSLATNVYRVDADQSFRVRYPLPHQQVIPARVEYEALGNELENEPAFPIGLPVDPRFIAPQLTAEGAITATALPTGRYRRVLYPQPPFDALFPPVTGPLLVNTGENRLDSFALTSTTLDPPETRGVTLERAEGLDGWQVWVADRITDRRISTVKTLSGTAQTVTLDTSGESYRAGNGGLGDDVEVILAPPASYIGIPRFINPVNGGDLGTIRYPALFQPVRVGGYVVQPNDSRLGFASRLTFESVSVQTITQPTPLLHYTTSLNTDGSGGFSTVLPPGTYNVTIEPLRGTGFAKARQVIVIASDSNDIRLQPPRRTIVQGRAVLSDGRPANEAEVLATPQTPTSAQDPKPRPNQTRVGPDGSFTFELDQGFYLLTIIPKPGTGFPRVVTPIQVVPEELDLREPPIQVPVPYVLDFQIRDGSSAENLVASAFVRIYTVRGASTDQDLRASASEAVEIGNGMTDAAGRVEILLAPRPE